MAKGPTKPSEIDILAIRRSSIDAHILGTTPFIFNRMAEKARRELLMPKGRKTRADRAQSLKHVPLDEYRASVHRWRDIDDEPTRLCFPAPGFKGAMMTAALDLPGVSKSEIGRLVWVEGVSISIFGVPQIFMSVVRSADINRTPDIRTRAILPRWACKLTINFVQPKLNGQAMTNLLAAAGVTCGVGDFRQEKGKGSYGQFEICAPDHPEFKSIVESGGRSQQDAALADPQPFDVDTAEMLDWFDAEVVSLTGRKAA